MKDGVSWPSRDRGVSAWDDRERVRRSGRKERDATSCAVLVRRASSCVLLERKRREEGKKR